MRVHELSTPAALVDLERLERNAARMAARARRLGLLLRPHVKTHKTVEIARLSVREGAAGLTISTLAEGRALVDAGLRDLVWAMTPALGRIDEALALARRAERFAFVLDHADALDALERASRAAGLRPGVFLKVDCGYGRSGVRPEAPEARALARRLARSTALELRGLLTHAGHAYHAASRADVLAAARQERDLPRDFAEQLRAEGLVVPELSIGSTPTLCASDDELPAAYEGLDEARPGNYLFFDRTQAALGSCADDDIAFSVLASVIGRYPARAELVLDAGALALSKDAGATHREPGCGHGRVARADGEPLEPLRVVDLSQEHARVACAPGEPLPVALGERVRIVPNHSCLSAALFERLHVVRGDEIVDVWPTVRGW